jgi:adenosylhomocysteine nucleosidase
VDIDALPATDRDERLITIGIVVALPLEARTVTRARLKIGDAIAIGDHALLALAGMGAARARAAAQVLVQRGATGLVSWGVAGGLDPALASGRLLLPKRIVADDGRSFIVDAAWRWRLEQLLAGPDAPAGGVLLGSDRILDTVGAKQEAFRTTHASAVDMESAAIADVAQQAQLPFVAIRAIVDAAGETLPAVTKAAIDDDGRINPVRLLLRLLFKPFDVLRLILLARRFARASATLSAAARACASELATAAGRP